MTFGQRWCPAPHDAKIAFNLNSSEFNCGRKNLFSKTQMFANEPVHCPRCNEKRMPKVNVEQSKALPMSNCKVVRLYQPNPHSRASGWALIK